jgi:rod shape-determining protein MreD
VTYLGLSRGKLNGEVMGFFLGLTWDIFSTDVFGVRVIIFTIIGYLSGSMNKDFDKDNVFTQIVAVFLANIAYWIGFSLIYYIIPEEGSGSYKPFVITAQGSLKIALTVIIAPLIFYILNVAERFGRRHINGMAKRR